MAYEMLSLLLLSLLPAVTSASPGFARQSAPTVTIKNGTLVGSSSNGIDTFNGIPYAQPPVADLRLRPPQTITKTYGTIQATKTPRACPQFLAQMNASAIPPEIASILGELGTSGIISNVTNQGEDCLTINVNRPAGTTSSSKLPVLFWIFGGGFEFGSTGQYDGSNIVAKSVSLGKPIIFVEVNYRLNGFGFLAGNELAQQHCTNLGLRDQRLGLQWTADNIAAFGGDSSQVTLWGESAGSISVFDQTVINNGDNTYNGNPLFHGAVMSSGSIVPAENVSSSKSQAYFDQVAQAAGCGSAVDKVACLRSVDFATYQKAANSLPSFTSGVLAYLPRPDAGDAFYSKSPEELLYAGQYAKVPIIIGEQQDEGTLFSIGSRNITTNDELIQDIASNYPDNPNAVADVTAFVSNYPDEPLLGQPDGSPFNTGPLNNIYPEFKRLAAITGDLRFTLMRRVYLSIISAQVPCWSELSSYLYGTPVLGTFHTSDIRFSFQAAPLNQTVTETIQRYLISFVNHLDPNAMGTTSPLIPWPQWNSSSPMLVNENLLNNTLISDDFRQGAYEYLRDVAVPQGQFRT